MNEHSCDLITYNFWDPIRFFKSFWRKEGERENNKTQKKKRDRHHLWGVCFLQSQLLKSQSLLVASFYPFHLILPLSLCNLSSFPPWLTAWNGRLYFHSASPFTSVQTGKLLRSFCPEVFKLYFAAEPIVQIKFYTQRPIHKMCKGIVPVRVRAQQLARGSSFSLHHRPAWPSSTATNPQGPKKHDLKPMVCLSYSHFKDREMEALMKEITCLGHYWKTAEVQPGSRFLGS